MALHKAILVIDVQNALCIGESATYKAMDTISNINNVICKARKAAIPVIFIQHETHDGTFINGSEDWQLAQELNKDISDITIAKHTSDAFKDTTLTTRLDAMQINHLIVCGMQSEFCVDSTIRRALALNYAITVIADGHTTTDNDVLPAQKISKHHNSTWENITSYDVKAKCINANDINF